MRVLYRCLVIVLLGAATRAGGQSANFWTQCTTGAFQACASVELWNETDPVTNQLYLFIRVANVQGFDALTPYAIASIGINDLLVTDPTPSPGNISSRTGSATGFGALSGNTYLCAIGTVQSCEANSTFRVGEFWTAGITDDRPGSGYDGDAARVFNNIRADNRFMIWGCTQPDGSVGPYWGPGTCKGFVTWRAHAGGGLGFRITQDISVDLAFEGYDETGARLLAQCQTGVDCVTVTPEPATVALVASGLAGLMALHRRRRRM